MGDNEITCDKYVTCNNNKHNAHNEQQIGGCGPTNDSASKSESADANLLASSLSKEDGRNSVEEKDVLLQHHHDLSNLCRDLEQHKLDMQRQHMQLAEALRNLNLGASNELDSCRRGDKLRVRKEGRDEHGMNGAAFVPTSSATATCTTPGGKRDIWDEELASETLDEGQITEIPELSKYSSGLPPRTIPFRSASFSQVDITSEGKYVRNPRSPITLKPTAFCLMNNSYASGSSTLPRAHGSNTVKQQQHPHHYHHRHSHHQHPFISASEQDQLPTTISQMSPPISYQTSCGGDCGPFHHLLSETISEHADSNSSSLNNEFTVNELDDFNNMENLHSTTAPCDVTPSNVLCGECRHPNPNLLHDEGVLSSSSNQCTIGTIDNTGNMSTTTLVNMQRDSNEFEDNLDSGVNCDNDRNILQFNTSIESETKSETECADSNVVKDESVTRHDNNDIPIHHPETIPAMTEKEESTNASIMSTPPPAPPPPPPPPSPSDPDNLKRIESTSNSSEDKLSDIVGVPDMQGKLMTNNDGNVGNDKEDSALKTTDNVPSSSNSRHNKPQLIRSPPLIREESIMARSSSEEGPKSDQDEDRADINLVTLNNANESGNGDKGLGKTRKIKKHVLLDLEIGGSSISGSGGEEADKDKHGLFRQSSGQSDESGEGDRQSDGCTSPPISSPHPTGLTLHRSHLSAGNSPLTEALALDSPMRRGSTSAPSTAPTSSHSASNLHSTSLPQTSSVSGQSYFKGPTENDLGGQREGDRLSSLSSPNVYNRQMPRRYNKRPLRGPYGEMLEAEMKKLVPRNNRDFDSLDFWRESKSSSPSRSTQDESVSITSGSGASRTSQQPPKFMSSMDDLNLTKQNKHSSTRSRKISANLPVTHYHTKEDGTPMAFHQRTASSPSQLLYAASSSERDSLADRRPLPVASGEEAAKSSRSRQSTPSKHVTVLQQIANHFHLNHHSQVHHHPPPQPQQPPKKESNMPIETNHTQQQQQQPEVMGAAALPQGAVPRRSPTPEVVVQENSATNSATSSMGCIGSTEKVPVLRTGSAPRDASPRGHVLAEIMDTEKSYVESLRIIVKKYMEPLKASDIIDNGLVDEIFFQIPNILTHHEQLLTDLQRVVKDDNQAIAHVLLDTFRKPTLLDCYSLFVNNWKNAKGSLKMAVASKPQLDRFLEQQARQHKGKLTVDSLLIMPIQRIPRYELLVKELLKHTEAAHEDHGRLLMALEKIKKFAVHIDCASVDPNGTREVEIEGWGSGLGHLVRQDVVTLCSSSNVKKERALFLFADSLVIASIKRKSTMRKPPQGQTANNLLEGCKFKLLMKIQLTDIHILNEEYSELHGAVGGAIGGSGSSGGSVKSGGSSHSEELDDLRTLHKMMDLATLLKCPHVGLDEILRELISGLKHHDNNHDILDIEIRTGESSDTPEALKIIFGTSEKKNSWVDAFQDTLGKFIRYGFGKLPQVQFVQALPIRKTRAGLQLSCAAPVTLYNKASKTLEMTDLWVTNSDGYVGQICILTLYPEPAITSCNGVCNSKINCIISVPPPSYPHLGPSACHAESFSHDTSSHHSHPHFYSLGYDSEDDHHRSKSGYKASSSEHWSVWLGTDDGSLHVYDCSDSVRVKKNRHKMQHTSPVNCMVYFDRRVFVALGNGDVAVYNRNPNGKGWLVNDVSWVTIGSAVNPITKMLGVHNQVWCAAGSQIKVYGENGGMLELLQTIQVVIEGNQIPRSVTIMVASDQYIWIALHSSSIIKCYSSTTYEPITEINVAPDVTKILAGCDDIIRQHKSACLRVTALLAAPDKSLWIGTSAGVLLTINSAGQNPKISPLCHGHTGQVRFLTCCITRDSWTVISGGDGYEEFRAVPICVGNNGTSLSGVAPGYVGESAGDLSGREDSTNHLLIWKIPKLM